MIIINHFQGLVLGIQENVHSKHYCIAFLGDFYYTLFLFFNHNSQDTFTTNLRKNVGKEKWKIYNNIGNSEGKPEDIKSIFLLKY